MTGEVFRLRAIRAYEKKRPRGSPGITSRDFSAPPGKHFVVAVLGVMPETMDLTQDWIKDRMREGGWEEAE